MEVNNPQNQNGNQSNGEMDESFLLYDIENIFDSQSYSNCDRNSAQNKDNSYSDQQVNEVRVSNCKVQNKMTNFVIRPFLYPQEFQIDLFTGVYLTQDGIIRYFPSILPVYFGFNQYETSQVQNYSSSSGFINIDQFRRNIQNVTQYEQAIQYIQKFPNIQQQFAEQVLTRFGTVMNALQKVFQKQKYTEAFLNFKDDEFQKFQSMCMSFLDEFHKQNQNMMFTYQILRLSQKHKDIDISNYGYSKSYLDLLGINPETLSQIILRGKQIDLIHQKNDITNQCLASMSGLGTKQECHICDITTFDGFPLKIVLKKRNYGQMLMNSQIIEGEHDYYFVITEIDVDLYHLQQLINYRQRLGKNSILSYDDFIRKELSYLFEDVEYSIHSQAFIEKYYKENTEQLEKRKMQCCYKYVTN
ncbi:hypothetical protein TTHERM_00327220 (macronuclear) [Tetrahymena thermophila SB210]|uniref:Uncharacterized protein n=1 Tax=Tetrahymena thermophila (strain SB210) TaxID=312017 RepID=I7MJG0_TETTS|nr:hypothetical protein TTHERM_00327220 [Tetrahymena thermophila SB210]EAS06240.2 hypothetical protein TTHERM_00327220 [Tetrahymena thermophila SB210]|eukprot:XP_001026485.2 hypothetical protein TTHERM_00327220 [Tetrahymena thermophila SB210]